jgi:Ca2+-binding RTX toxin-like protein
MSMTRRLALLTVLALALPGSGLASTEASPPVVVTGSAVDVGPFRATFEGTVNPNGRLTDYYFEYGTTASYGARTVRTSAGNAATTIAVSATVGDLRAGTTYHFRIVGKSDAGTTVGADRTFATPSPPDVSTGGVSDVGPSSAALHGKVNPRGRAASYFFEYGATAAYGSRTGTQSAGSGAASVDVSTGVSGLSPGARYHYRLVAWSDAGTVRGVDRSFVTSSRPIAVTGPSSSVGPTSAVVSGTVNPDGRATGWWFEYGTSTRYGTRTAEQGAGSGVAAVNVSTTLTGLASGTNFHYRLVARNSSGPSAGADATFTTLAAPAAATGPPTVISARYATVTGTVNPNGRPTVWYVDYGPTTAYGLRSPPVSAGSAIGVVPVSFRLTGLAPGGLYHYRVVAANDAGTTVGSDASFVTAPLPVGPGGRTVRCSILGTQGADVLHGTVGRDVICGLGGDDRIVSGRGNDRVYGGPGGDIAQAGGGNDLVYGEGGRDRLFGQSGNDQLYGGEGSDRLFGGLGNDVLAGGSLGDVLIGGVGADRLLGGGNNDIIFARDGRRDWVNGGPGRDLVVRDRFDLLLAVEFRR